MRRVFHLAAAAGGSLLALTIATRAADRRELPPGPNRALVYGRCQTCHDLQYLVESAGIPRRAWSDTLDSMQRYGMRLPDDERARLLDYLATYLGPSPPPPAPGDVREPNGADGATVFKEQCEACHQADGRGVAGQFPPLAGNRDLFLSDDYPARVALFGLKGGIEVNQRDFNAEMPSFSALSDQQIAAVAAYVRRAWGNAALRPRNMPEIDVATVAKLRRRPEIAADQIRAWRKALKSRAAR